MCIQLCKISNIYIKIPFKYCTNNNGTDTKLKMISKFLFNDNLIVFNASS